MFVSSSHCTGTEMSVQYSIKKSKVLLGLSKGNGDWDQRIVTELDTALNRWIDDLPDHRSFPLLASGRETLISAYQCAGTRRTKTPSSSNNRLHFIATITSYRSSFTVRISQPPKIKRPRCVFSMRRWLVINIFLQTFPSLALSLNAARSCSHIADIYRKRVGDKPLPLTQACPNLSFPCSRINSCYSWQ